MWSFFVFEKVGLYEEPERPGNAIDYIKKFLGAPTGVDVEEVLN